MLQSEFEKRIGMVVTPEEYHKIEAVYMDVDKDEFCRLWVKKNSRRVAVYKAEQKRNMKEEKQRERLFRIYEKFRFKDYFSLVETLCHTALNRREQKVLTEEGISLKKRDNTYLNMLDVTAAIKYKIHLYE